MGWSLSNVPWLAKKEKQGGSNFFGGIGDFAVEEAKSYDRNYEKADDQGNQEISNDSSFNGGDYHEATSYLKNRSCLTTANPLDIEYCLLRFSSRKFFNGGYSDHIFMTTGILGFK